MTVIDIDSRRRQQAAAHIDDRAEAAVLSCVMLDRGAIDEVADLSPSHFGHVRWRACWAAALRLHAAGVPVEGLSLRSELLAHGELERVGDDAIASLMETVPEPYDVAVHARRVRDHATVRAVVAAAQSILARASQPVEDAASFATDAEAAVARCGAAAGHEGPVAMRDAVIGTVERLNAQGGGVSSDAIGTRFASLDFKLGGGFRPGELHLIAGRPGMGKTALGLDLALSMAHTAPGVVFSLEMSRDELVRRALASEGRIDGGRLRTAKLTGEDWERLQIAGARLAERGMHIDDTSGITLSRVRSTLRRHQVRHGLRWAMIDYVGLMRSDDRGIGREEQIGGISRGLKALAKELAIPIIALAQLNRDLEKRPVKDRRPQLADLRDSGSLEQDADAVLFVYRPEVYQRDAHELRGVAEIIIGKQRSGPTGIVPCRYVHEHTRFEEAERMVQPPTYDDAADWSDDDGGYR